mgnify:FL=1
MAFRNKTISRVNSTKYRRHTGEFHVYFCFVSLKNVICSQADNPNYLEQLSKNVTRSGLTSVMLNFLRVKSSNFLFYFWKKWFVLNSYARFSSQCRSSCLDIRQHRSLRVIVWKQFYINVGRKLVQVKTEFHLVEKKTEKKMKSFEKKTKKSFDIFEFHSEYPMSPSFQTTLPCQTVLVSGIQLIQSINSTRFALHFLLFDWILFEMNFWIDLCVFLKILDRRLNQDENENQRQQPRLQMRMRIIFRQEKIQILTIVRCQRQRRNDHQRILFILNRHRVPWRRTWRICQE